MGKEGAWPRLMRASVAEEYLGGTHVLLKQLTDGGHLKPLVSRNRMTVYDREQVDAVLDRFAVEGWPEVAGAESG